MGETIEVGDVVRLKSGGPLMVVEGTKSDNKVAECRWFDSGDSFPSESDFYLHSLTKNYLTKIDI